MRTEGHGWEWQTPSAKHAKSWYTLRVSITDQVEVPGQLQASFSRYVVLW